MILDNNSFKYVNNNSNIKNKNNEYLNRIKSLKYKRFKIPINLKLMIL